MLTRVAFIATEEDGGAIGECVSGYGNYHDLGGGKHQPPTGHGYPPPHHKASRGKRGGKREKERRQKRAKHGTTKPSDLSAEKPTDQPSDITATTQFADDSDTSSEDIGRRLARRKVAVKFTNQPSDLSANKPTDQPSDMSANKSTDQPTDMSANKSTDQPSDMSANKPTDQPTDLSANKPTDQPSDMSANKSTDLPTDLSANKPTDQPTDLSANKSTDKPSDMSDSPGISIYTCLSSQSQEKNSIYDNWPLEECYTVREADIPQETRELLLVRRLNTLKDSPRSDKTIKQMKHYTAELKESKMKHEGPHDMLNQMFVPKRGSHRLKSTDRGKKGVAAMPINTNIDCPGQRPSIKAMVDFAGSMDGASLETSVIFRDVSKRLYIMKSMSRIGYNCRWIVSTEGDCLFAFKLHGKMWIKIYDTVRTSNPNSAWGYIEVKLPSALKPIGFIGNKCGSAKMHEVVFYTFTKMEDTGEYNPR